MKSINCKIVTIVYAVLIGCMSACSTDGQRSRPASIVRLDRELEEGKLPADADVRTAAENLFAISGYGMLSDSSLAAYNSNPSISFHREAVERNFADIGDLESELGIALSNIEDDYPAVRIPRLYAIISPFNQSVITIDSVMYIGLNHYLGVDYEAYGYFPDYVRMNKKRERIVPDVVEALVRQYYPYEPESDYPTVLSRLLYEGSVVDAVMRATGLSEMEALGVSDDSYRWLEDNEKEIWNALVTRKLLYSTDELVGERLVRPSAVTSLLHPDAPGRAGRFSGHRIVRSYLKNNSEKPPYYVLLPDFYDGQETLAESKYR